MDPVERGEPLAALGSWLGEAESGAGHLVLVAGEAGIGKTSLARELCRQHEPAARVWWGACDALSTPTCRKRAEELLREAWELATSTGDLQRLWPAAAGRAGLAWLADDTEAIPHLVSDTFGLAVRLRQRWAVGELGFWLWRAGGLERTPAEAAEPYALQIDGDWEAAAEAWKQIGCPYETAVALADSGRSATLRPCDERWRSSGSSAPRRWPTGWQPSCASTVCTTCLAGRRARPWRTRLA